MSLHRYFRLRSGLDWSVVWGISDETKGLVHGCIRTLDISPGARRMFELAADFIRRTTNPNGDR